MTPIRVAVQSDGSPDPRWHSSDEQDQYRSLAMCRLPVLARSHAREVALSCFAATMMLPAADDAVPIEVPDDSWQGWDWSSGDAVLMELERDPLLPQLFRMVVPTDEWCQLEIAGTPMGVRRIAPDDADWRGGCYAAEVFGFVGETMQFWAQVRSRSADGRELLLAALATIRTTSLAP